VFVPQYYNKLSLESIFRLIFVSVFRGIIYVCLFVLTSSLAHQGLSQGMYTSFGRNRVGSNNFKWETTGNALVTIYYHDNGAIVAKNALEIALSETISVERLVGATLSEPLYIIVFNNINEYRQSNVDLTNTPINPAGYSNIRQNIFPVYFDGDYNHLKKQVRMAIGNAILTDLFYGGTIQEKVRTNVLFSLPDWYYNGLLHYIGESWNVTDDDEMRDKIESKSFQNFNTLSREDEILAGKSIWYYIGQENGAEAISNIIFWTQYERSAEGALIRSTGLGMAKILQNWRSWYYTKYAQENRLGNVPKGTESSPDKIAKYKHTRFTISPNGKYMAIVTNNSGLVKVWLYNVKNKSTKLLQKSGYKSETITSDNYYPLIAWNPDSRKLGIITYKDNQDQLKEINIINGKFKYYDIGKHDGVRDFCYSPHGDSIVLSAFSYGQSDLFYADLKTAKLSRITNDYYLDINPSFMPDGTLLFASKRPTKAMDNDNILNVSNYPTTIFSYEKNGQIQSLGKPKFGANYYAPIYYGSGLITCLTDETGIVNAVVTPFDSNSPFVFVSNYKRNILYQDIAQEKQQLAELILNNERYYIYLSDLAVDVIDESKNLDPKNTTYRSNNPIGYEPFNSAGKTKKLPISNDSLAKDSLRQDTTISTKESPYFISNFPVVDYDLDRAMKVPTLQSAQGQEGKVRTSFYMNYLVTQTDNSNLGYPYYPIEMDSQAMKVPFFSFNLEAEAADIFRNYIIKGGVRFHGLFEGHDYRLDFKALQFKVDFDAGVLQRKKIYGFLNNQSIFNQGEIWVGASYPFSERSRIRATVRGKQDRIVPGLDNSEAILRPTIDRKMAISTIEWVFDNSIDRSINRNFGVRSKVYGEYYQFTNFKGSMINLGFDIRRNVPVVGELMWATRLAGSTSPGNFKTIYYLGGIETWINPQYNQTLPFARDPNYTFLALAPNLRGYPRNISYGYTTTVLSSELRFPIISHFYKAPLYNQFYKTFTLSTFVDMGGAWNGINPYNSPSPLNTKTYTLPNYIVTVTSPGNPWLLGTGLGVRAYVFGYLFKFERAWGYRNNKFGVGMNYLSIGLDF